MRIKFNFRGHKLDDSIMMSTFSGTGPGGQSRNKSSNCVRLRLGIEDLPEDLRTKISKLHPELTEILATGQSEKSQKSNLDNALTTLRKRLEAALHEDPARETAEGTARLEKEKKKRNKHEAKKRKDRAKKQGKGRGGREVW